MTSAQAESAITFGARPPAMVPMFSEPAPSRGSSGIALALAARGYQPAQPRTGVAVGGEGVLAALKLGIHLARRAGRIGEHDATIGGKLAWILAGGSLPHPAMVSEAYLLDLEREAFLSLCGEPKTQARIQYTLKTGKTLRN